MKQAPSLNLRRWSLAELDAMDRAEFTRVVGPVFEHSPSIAEAAWARRPFRTLDVLYRALWQTVSSSRDEDQVVLIQAHPDLVDGAALAGTLAPASAREQTSAGLGCLAADEVTAFRERLENSREQEIATALGEIAKIVRLRLDDLISR